MFDSTYNASCGFDGFDAAQYARNMAESIINTMKLRHFHCIKLRCEVYGLMVGVELQKLGAVTEFLDTESESNRYFGWDILSVVI